MKWVRDSTLRERGAERRPNEPLSKGWLATLAGLEKETEMTSIHDKLSRRDAVKLFGVGSLGLGIAASAPLSASARQATPDTGLRGEITVWYFPFGPGVEELYAQFAEEFGQEYPGIRVNLECGPLPKDAYGDSGRRGAGRHVHDRRPADPLC